MNQQNIQWTKIQVRQTIGALGIFLSVLILQIFAAVITLALSKVTGITPNSSPAHCVDLGGSRRLCFY